MDMDIGYRNKVRYSNGPGKHTYVKGPNIKDVRWEKEVFEGTMKYFKNKLMGCEIFLKISDSSPKILLRSSFLFFSVILYLISDYLSTKF